ncbi:MAG: methionyl-tRNA formyltransferase [Burkholderiaceae bacterium]
MNIIFAGTPQFARSALLALCQAGHTVRLVLSQPDRPAGRGQRLVPSPVKQFALEHGLALEQPPSLRLDGREPKAAEQIHERLRSTPHDVMIVAAYGLILPQSILDIAPLGCLNIHASLLPRWRGAAPIQRAIEAGDVETGITIMRMDAGLDTGPMLLWERTEIGPQETAGALGDRLAQMGAVLIVRTLDRLTKGPPLREIPQPQSGATYAAKLRREEARLDFNRSATTLALQIRAFNPAPGASAVYGDTSLKIWRAQPRPLARPAPPGTVLSVEGDEIAIACAKGVLGVLELQKPGGTRLAAGRFLQGFRVEPGTRFT